MFNLKIFLLAETYQNNNLYTLKEKVRNYHQFMAKLDINKLKRTKYIFPYLQALGYILLVEQKYRK